MMDLSPWVGRCRSCQAGVVWATSTRTARPMPVNRVPSERGNVALTVVKDRDGECRLVAGVLGHGPAAGARAAGRELYTSHFSDCPDADGHRQRRRRAGRATALGGGQ